MMRNISGTEVRLMWKSPMLQQGHYMSILYDLRYLLSLKEISSHIIFEDKRDILQSMVQLYGQLNEAQVNTRVPSGRDCLDDDDNWATAWTLESHLVSLANKLVKGLNITEKFNKQNCFHQ